MNITFYITNIYKMSTDSESIWKFLSHDCVNDYTLIMPSIGVGNVAQLACDLIISSLNMKKIASVYHPALIPVVGYDPFDLKSDVPCTSCEIYKSDTKKILVMQLRASLIYHYAQEFLQDVINTFKSRNVKEVIILSSCFAHEKKRISSSSFRYIANKLCSYKEKAKSLNWEEHVSSDGDIWTLGGGVAYNMYSVCEELSMPCLIIYKYCSEGDNVPDAYEMLEYFNGVFPIFDPVSDFRSQLIQPVSWNLLFGGPLPQEIY